MAKGAYISIDGKARKIKKGYIGVLDKTVHFDGDMYYDSDSECWVSDSPADVAKKASFSTANVEFDGVLYEGLDVETYDANTGITFKYVYIPDTDINVEFSSNGKCTLYDPGEELDTNRTYVLKIYTGTCTESARKIKKAYISIGGVARPCWSGGELAYYGTITPLSEVRSYGTAKSVGNYALFAGGFDANDGYTNKVDAYDESLTRTTPTGLKDGAYSLTSAKVGSYALFAGGSNNSTTYSSDVTSYNTGLTVSYPTSLSTGRSYPAGASVGNYALIAGGRTSSDYSTQVNSYNTSLTRSTATRLSEGRYMFAGTSVGNYAIFGGGLMKYYASSATVDAYNTSLTRTIPTKLSVSRGELAATTVGGYALFVGGGTAVDAYNTSLTRTALTSLNATQSTLGATTIKNYALFGGGSSSGDTTVYAYDESLTRTTFSLTVARYQSSATTVGNYALFGGGRNLDINLIDSVEAFTVA